MTFYSNLSLKPLAAGVALLGLPLGYSQIPDPEIDSIFSRLNGDDYDARYEARMDLQNAVSTAGAPGNEGQPALVEGQLLQRLESEPLLTTRLWILRQLQLIGSDASIGPLEAMLTSDSRPLVDAVRMTLRALSGEANVQEPTEPGGKLEELLLAFAAADNEALKAAIFERIAQKSPKQAEAILLESPLPEYIRTAAISKKRRLAKAALALLSSGDPAQQIVVIGALDGKVSSQVEGQLISLLETDNETLQLQLLEALGRVGTSKSLDAVLALSDARSKDVQEAAIDTLASIQDPRLDRNLFAAARKGATAERVKAVKAMSFRASDGIAALINDFAADPALELALREEAITAMERAGNLASLPILVKIVLEEDASGLRKEAQKMLKRLTLRIADAAAAWAAFRDGFDAADEDGKLALMLVADSVPSQAMVAYLRDAYESGEPSIQKMVVRVLPSWRNWDGGNALLAIAEKPESEEAIRSLCFKGIGRIILGSDENYSLAGKFELAEAALEAAKTEEERNAILGGFRYVTSKDKRYVGQNDVDPGLKAAVRKGQNKK